MNINCTLKTKITYKGRSLPSSISVLLIAECPVAAVLCPFFNVVDHLPSIPSSLLSFLQFLSVESLNILKSHSAPLPLQYWIRNYSLFVYFSEDSVILTLSTNFILSAVFPYSHQNPQSYHNSTNPPNTPRFAPV